MSLVPGDEVASTKKVTEVKSKGEIDKARKEVHRFNNCQKLVDGINNIIAVATLATDGVKIIQNAMQLPEADRVWLVKAINRAGEWEIFNSLNSRYREYYVKEALKSRRHDDGLAGVSGNQSDGPVTARGGDKFGHASMGPPPAPSGFRTLLKLQDMNDSVANQPILSQAEAISGN